MSKECEFNHRNRGSIVIEFPKGCMDCEEDCHDPPMINVHLNNANDGEVSITPPELLKLLMRTTAAVVVTMSDSLADAFYNVSQVGGEISNALKEFRDKEYDVKIHVPPKKDDMN